MIGAGIVIDGLVSATTFAGAYVLIAVGYSGVWSWWITRQENQGTLRTPMLTIGAIGAIGFGVIGVVTGDWTAYINTVLIVGIMGFLWREFRDYAWWSSSQETAEQSDG